MLVFKESEKPSYGKNWEVRLLPALQLPYSFFSSADKAAGCLRNGRLMNEGMVIVKY